MYKKIIKPYFISQLDATALQNVQKILDKKKDEELNVFENR
jgi:hypothetical protein